MTAPAPAPAPASPARVGTGRNIANWAHQLITRNPPGHIRYQMGGDDPYDSPDPRVLDCSSFVDWCFFNGMGKPLRPGRTTAAVQLGMSKRISTQLARSVKGSLFFIGNHHVEVSLGNNNTAGAHTDNKPLPEQVDIGPVHGGFDSAGLLPGVDWSDSATNPQAAAELSQIVGYPVSVTDPNEFGAAGGGGAAGGAAGGAGGDTGSDAFNRLLNVYTWGLRPNISGDILSGPRAMMNDSPILPYIGNMLSSTFRNFCSCPNGDFMAWFPDYFGLFGTAAKMNVKAIELQDFTLEWIDQQIVTHQYVVGVPVTLLDQSTGKFVADGTSTSFAWENMTGGIATMDFPNIFQPIFGKPASPEFIEAYLSRFGGRPDMVQLPTITQGSLGEFFMALYLFMQRWAAQFQANVPMTFMPELWPGMLLALPEFDFQAYISEVQHSFKFGPGGGFHTTAAVCAPSRTDDDSPIFGLLPLGGEEGQKNIKDIIDKPKREEAARQQKLAADKQAQTERDRTKPLPGPGGSR